MRCPRRCNRERGRCRCRSARRGGCAVHNARTLIGNGKGQGRCSAICVSNNGRTSQLRIGAHIGRWRNRQRRNHGDRIGNGDRSFRKISIHVSIVGSHSNSPDLTDLQIRSRNCRAKVRGYHRVLIPRIGVGYVVAVCVSNIGYHCRQRVGRGHWIWTEHNGRCWRRRVQTQTQRGGVGQSRTVCRGHRNAVKSSTKTAVIERDIAI